MTFHAWSDMVPMGLGSAINTCVGNTLGSGDGRGARRAAIVGLACALVVEACMASGVLGLGDHLVGSSGVLGLGDHLVRHEICLRFLIFIDIGCT